MAKKKRTTLPRLTVLAMNRRDLAAFVQAVETLRLVVEDLRMMWERKKQSGAKPGRQPAAKPTVPVTERFDLATD